MKKNYFTKTSLLHLNVATNSDQTKKIQPVNPQKLDSDSEIEKAKVISGTIEVLLP